MDEVFPRVSVALLTYNQESMVAAAAQSCFDQDCPPLEIVLSDDCSTDGTFARLVEAAASYRGHHRVIVRRNEHNVGIGEHYNLLQKATTGELIVTAAGDDVSAPDRVRRLVEAWDADGRKADLIASHVVDMDDTGELHGVIEVDELSVYKSVADWARHRPYVIGAGHAYTRRMVDRFGPMLPGIAYEDQIMVFRAIMGGGAINVALPLVRYRRGGTSRLPDFESDKERENWSDRQLQRIIAERKQLLRDAEMADVYPTVHRMLGLSLKRDVYLLSLRHSEPGQDLWQLFHEAAPLPILWRFKKQLHTRFPNVTARVKSMLSIFHRRYWRSRRAKRLHP